MAPIGKAHAQRTLQNAHAKIPNIPKQSYSAVARSGEAEGQTMFKMQVHIHIVRAVTAFLQNVEWEPW